MHNGFCLSLYISSKGRSLNHAAKILYVKNKAEEVIPKYYALPQV